MNVRKNAILWLGKPTDLAGPELGVGQRAPSDFALIARDFSAVAGAALAGQVRILCTVPSLDTPVCDVEMRRFNAEVTKLAGLKLYVVSMDLPFAQKRWCGSTGSTNVEALSDFRDRAFGRSYGVFAPGTGLLARAVFVIDKSDTMRHVEYVKEVSEEPNYAAAIAAARSLL